MNLEYGDGYNHKSVKKKSYFNNENLSEETSVRHGTRGKLKCKQEKLKLGWNILIKQKGKLTW